MYSLCRMFLRTDISYSSRHTVIIEREPTFAGSTVQARAWLAGSDRSRHYFTYKWTSLGNPSNTMALICSAPVCRSMNPKIDGNKSR